MSPDVLWTVRQLLLVIAAVFGVIVYRLAVMTLFQRTGDIFWLKSAKIVTSITAATLNLIIIMIMNQVRIYGYSN